MEEYIINNIVYTIDRQNIKIGDTILDKNSETIYEADLWDADELGWVVISTHPIPQS